MDELRLDLDDLRVVGFQVDMVGDDGLLGLGVGHGTTEVGASCYCFPPYCCCASCCAAADELGEQAEGAPDFFAPAGVADAVEADQAG
ncbi:hypothetical protein SUDANB95_01969 [Actinosynnema sp. ALI-1.44]